MCYRDGFVQGTLEVERIRIYGKVTVPGAFHSSDQLTHLLSCLGR